MAGLFGLFDYTKEGPGIRKDAPKKKAFFVFFETYFRNFFKFFSINLVYLLLSAPILTHGMTATGITNVTRNIARDKHSFGLSDFFETIRKNWKQSLIFGVLDILIMVILGYDLLYFYLNLASGETMIYVFFFLTFAMCIVYAFMRMYIYLMMITFDLSIMKLLKNALFFAILGIKRNIMALLAVIVVVAFWYVLRMVFFPVAVILPFILMFSVCSLASAYAAYPKIKEIMIDPYYSESKE